jgi:predicted nucleic-acid-binding Zn-ribbon protein
MADVSATDFFRFLREVRAGKPYECTYCGNGSYRYNEGARTGTVPVPPGKLTLVPEGAANGHPFYSISCSRCGRSDFFHLSAVADWIKANPEESA